MAIQNSAGKSVTQYTYDPFGKCLSVSGTMAATVGSINPLRYRGYYYDNETGYYYLATRYYNPDACRFLNADSLVCSGPGILGYNMYLYCQNNPVMFSDPSGMGNYHDPQMQQMMQEGMNNVQNWNMNDPVKVEDMSDDWKDMHADDAGGLSRKSNKGPRKDQRKGSQERQPKGERERNVGHPDGDEHSRVTKGNPSPKGKKNAPPIRKIEDQSPPSFMEEYLPSVNWGDVGTGLAVVGGGIAGGYLLYRAVRFLPSLAPPLWPTIPVNLAIP